MTQAEDGYRLWLRYDPLPSKVIKFYREHVTELVVPGDSATLDAVRAELSNGCAGLLGNAVSMANDVDHDGAPAADRCCRGPLRDRM